MKRIKRRRRQWRRDLHFSLVRFCFLLNVCKVSFLFIYERPVHNIWLWNHIHIRFFDRVLTKKGTCCRVCIASGSVSYQVWHIVISPSFLCILVFRESFSVPYYWRSAQNARVAQTPQYLRTPTQDGSPSPRQHQQKLQGCTPSRVERRLTALSANVSVGAMSNRVNRKGDDLVRG